MPRIKRQFSESGFEHIVSRGIGRQILFENDNDYRKYLKTIEKYSNENAVEICAYCLMENHVHMLVRGEGENIMRMMKQISTSYALYYNSKYDRCGHLFQNRYYNEPIISERQLICTFRYILNNPLKAGICKASAYKWSSYHAYGRIGSFVNTLPLEGLIGNREKYMEFVEEENDDEYAEFEKQRMSDEEARTIILKHIDGQSGVDLQKLGKESRQEVLRFLKNQGLSVRQIERLTGINRGVVQRA